jgi:hypothetical protein
MRDALRELATGRFQSGLTRLGECGDWHDNDEINKPIKGKWGMETGI